MIGLFFGVCVGVGVERRKLCIWDCGGEGGVVDSGVGLFVKVALGIFVFSFGGEIAFGIWRVFFTLLLFSFANRGVLISSGLLSTSAVLLLLHS